MASATLSLRIIVGVALLASTSACRRASSDSAGAPARTAASDAAHASPSNSVSPARALDAGTPPSAPADAAPEISEAAVELAPLTVEAALVALPVPGYRDATVHVPRGATKPRPVLVALHGNFDRPEWQCEVWQSITQGHPFILCPRGIPRRDTTPEMDRWEYGNADSMEKELEAGLAALSARFGAYVDPGPVLYTGFSLGGIMGVRVLRRKSSRFPVAVLTEGGFESWTPGFARSFKEGGGQRILFACGQVDCQLRSKASVAALIKAGAHAKMVSGGKVGHRYDGPVAEAIAAEWSWLVGDDPRWQK